MTRANTIIKEYTYQRFSILHLVIRCHKDVKPGLLCSTAVATKAPINDQTLLVKKQSIAIGV